MNAPARPRTLRLRAGNFLEYLIDIMSFTALDYEGFIHICMLGVRLLPISLRLVIS